MGFVNWGLNRANTTSGRSSITVRATDPVNLDREVAKAEQRGYVRAGNPYTAQEYNGTMFYQTMVYSEEAVEQINARAEAYRQAQEEKRAKRKATLKKGWQMLKDFMEDKEKKDDK